MNGRHNEAFDDYHNEFQTEPEPSEAIKSERYQKLPWYRRYSNALHLLAPFRCKDRYSAANRYMPGPGRGFLTLFSLHWLTSHIYKAARRRLSVSDLWNLRPEDSSSECCLRLERLWLDEVARKGAEKASLTRTIYVTFRTRIVLSTLALIVGVILQFLGPSILLSKLLKFVKEGGSFSDRGVYILVAIVACQLLRTYFFYGFSMVFSAFTCFRASGALQLMLYRKVIRLRSPSDQILGKIVNICLNDMDRLYDTFTAGPMIFSALVMFISGVAFNYVMVGPWSLLGFLIILLSYPILGWFAAITSRLRLRVVHVTDRRVNLISEILSAIRLIKMYSWEQSFLKSVAGVRQEEHEILQKAAFLQSTSNTIGPIIGVLATLATILGYILSGNTLDTVTAFSVISVINAMQFSIGTLPYGIKMITEVHVALCRIQRLLLLPDQLLILDRPDSDQWSLQIKNGTFAWQKTVVEKKKKNGDVEAADAKPAFGESTNNSSPGRRAPAYHKVISGSEQAVIEVVAENGSHNSNCQTEADSDKVNDPAKVIDPSKVIDPDENVELVPVLLDVDLTVRRGCLLGLAGSVGSGKSSLLAAFMDQLVTLQGSVLLDGSVAVAPQTAWIFDGSLRDNIVFGAKFDSDRYNRVLDACALRPDLEQLEAGDLTAIGERGTNLSGGQKQRVGLARAVYAEADIYLLDDPLSAVDAKVGRHIFDNCICGLLAGKTVLLVSHGVQFLSRCDEVATLRDGRLTERGTHAELLALSGDYCRLVAHETEAGHTASQQTRASAEPRPAHTLLEEENIESGGGAVEEHVLRTGLLRLLWRYCVVCGGLAMFVVLALVVLFGGGRIVSSIYLKYWLEKSSDGISYDDATFPRDVGIFCAIFAVFVLLGLLKGVGVALRVIKGATNVHNRMFTGLMASTLGYFERNPSARILNRFSRDLDELDNKIPMLTEFMLQGGAMILVQFLIPVAQFPSFIVVAIIFIVIYGALGHWLTTCIGETKHLENMVRAPVVHQLSSTVSGITVIRVFNKQALFIKRFTQLLDRHSSANLEYRLSVTWFSMRVEELSLLLLLTVTLFVLLWDGVSADDAGLAISSVYGWITFFSFWIQLVVDLRARLTAIERCEQFVDGLELEMGAGTCGGVTGSAGAGVVPAVCDEQWPSAGAIEMRGVCLRYRPELPLALCQLQVTIAGGQKVGVVGRTGAGKSTMISTLLRLTELESGSVLIDGVDIATLSLGHLRSRVGVIPQDPVLFSGSIRYNLDPFELYDDYRLWDVLEKANLKRKISRARGQLQMKVTADGDNFSVGERQLICLARALLRQNRVLLLDEATASVDSNTDRLIQQTIRECFSACTVITIAHRLNTVAHYDRVMVLDTGRVVEYDCPLQLMKRPESQFRRMMEDSGVTSVEQFDQVQ